MILLRGFVLCCSALSKAVMAEYQKRKSQNKELVFRT